jgi:hypothetical protein
MRCAYCSWKLLFISTPDYIMFCYAHTQLQWRELASAGEAQVTHIFICLCIQYTDASRPIT